MNLCTAILSIICISKATTNGESNNKHVVDKSSFNGLPKMESFITYEEMQKYFDVNQNKAAIDNPKNDSYIAAYNLHHNRPVNLNNDRIKRSAPELIKFEISDAKEPDEDTKIFFRQIQEKIQKSLNLSELVVKEKPENRSHIEKRSMKSYSMSNKFVRPNKYIHSENFEEIYEGNPEGYGGYHFDQFREKTKQRNILANQKAIYNPKLSHYSPEIRYVAPFTPALGRNSKSLPAGNFRARIPEYSQLHTITKPVKAVKVVPEINYVIKEVPAPALKVSEPISHQHLSGPITSQNEIGYQGYGYAVIKSHPDTVQEQVPYAGWELFGQDIIKQHLLQVGDEQLVQKEIEAGGQNPLHPLSDSKYSVLTSLVGKSPSDQLHGLTYLLGKEVQNSHRPQDSTAPILFHPKTGDGSQSATVPVSNVNSGEVLHSVQQIKPITEAPEEYIQGYRKSPDPVVEITPHPAPLSFQSMQSAGLSPNYDSLPHDHEQRYASRYAFGYRVRDFHTGNDFGHKQNRDVDGTTRGQYHILLPDGRIQNVIYRADKSGFHADVSFTSSHH